MRLGDLDALKDRFSLTGPIGVSVRRVIDKAPTIDAVPVVRCGQCKHWKTADDHCTHPAGLCATGKKARNNYCIFGERKVGEGDG